MSGRGITGIMAGGRRFGGLGGRRFRHFVVAVVKISTVKTAIFGGVSSFAGNLALTLILGAKTFCCRRKMCGR